MNFDPDFSQSFNQCSFDSVGEENVFMALMISSDLLAVSKGTLSSDGLQETKSFINFLQKVSGPVDQRVKPSFTKNIRSVDMLEYIFRSHDGIKSDRPHIADGATFTSNNSFNELLRDSILYSRDSIVYDDAGQGKTDTLGNATIKSASNNANLSRWEQMYDAKLLPPSVSTTATVLQSVSTAATNPASGASRKRKAEMTDHNQQSCLLKKPKRIYVEPTENDVLFGRGGRSNHHPGNKRYHEEKLRIQPRYKAAERAATTSISLELVNAVHAWGGRFLKLEDGTKDKWYEVSITVARKKASQALREVKENNLVL